VKNVNDDTTPHSKHAVYNTFIINTLTQLRKWQEPYSSKENSRVTGVHFGEEGTLLIIFQFNKIIFNYFYFQLWLVDKWKKKWKKKVSIERQYMCFSLILPNIPPLTSPASRVTELSNREQREKQAHIPQTTQIMWSCAHTH
jgi:hypothetical protein